MAHEEEEMEVEMNDEDEDDIIINKDTLLFYGLVKMDDKLYYYNKKRAEKNLQCTLFEKGVGSVARNSGMCVCVEDYEIL